MSLKKKFIQFIDSGWSALLVILVVLFTSFATMKGFNKHGLILAVIGELIYGYNNLMMGEVWTVAVKEPDKLIKKGLFKYIRHPLYLGCIITGYGLGLTLKSAPGLVLNSILTVPFLYYRAKREEKLLLEQLEAYEEYMKETGMFLPRLRE